MTTKVHIDDLIEIVTQGGKVTTGIDVYNKKGILLLDKTFLVTSTRVLEIIKENGVSDILLSTDGNSGLWDADGNLISSGNNNNNNEGSMSLAVGGAGASTVPAGLEKKLLEIEDIKQQAMENYKTAKECINKTLAQIKETGGVFDVDDVFDQVSHLAEFVTVMNNPFSYLTKEIVSYDEYLYNHSINVCTIGTTILNRFNFSFSTMINQFISTSNAAATAFEDSAKKTESYRHFQADELKHISFGYFLHDIGKVLVPDEILNKSGKLTNEEFMEVKKHSYDLGAKLLDKNKIDNPFISNCVTHHHGPFYAGEDRCYPNDHSFEEIPIYVKICKLADIYDAMTSKRCYKEAFNQINVVTDMVRAYARKDPLLQHILHAFIKSIGIYPPGSIVFLRNGQMAYVLESEGPIVIPFTDEQGNSFNAKNAPTPLDINEVDDSLKIDNRKSVKQPREVYDLLPSYLKTDAKAVAG